MKLQLISLFLAQGLFENALAKNHRVKIQNEQPKSKGRKLTNFQCTLMIKAVMYGDEVNSQHVEEIPECHLSGSALPVPLVNMPSWLSEKFINQEVASNADSLQLSEALVYDEGIYIPAEAQASFVQGPEERRNRFLNHGQSSRTVVAMRITNAGQANPSESNSALADSIFGSSGDSYNLKNGYNACTYGTYTFTEGTGNGITEVSTSANNDDSDIINEALGNAGIGQGSYNHVMACLPPDTLSGGSSNWIAWAYVNWYLSAYKGMWCSYPSSQMHEIGHNINFAHSGVGSNEYADGSCMLGYSYSSDEGPVMCFAAPKYYQLGWLSDRHVDISNGGSWSGKMYGISTYLSSGSSDATVVRIDASPDLYVSYNLATGISSGTQEFPNKVLVHSKNAGTSSYGLSFIETTLSAGDTETVNGNVIKFLSTGDGYANIEINESSPPNNPPTSPPNPNPTNAPNPNPTNAPNPNPTNAPNPNPTNAPNPNPTNAPNPNPTPSPTVDDDDIDDDFECVDDVNFYWENKKGRKKYCPWFGKKKKRCYRKPGALDACPLACNICDRSDTDICTDSRMRKKACKNATFCFWDRSTTPKSCQA